MPLKKRLVVSLFSNPKFWLSICFIIYYSCKVTFDKENKTVKGLVFNQYEGHAIKGEKLAQGWRKDSINFGYNKEVYKNPYYLRNDLHKNRLIGNSLKFFYYKNGLAINGYYEIHEDDMVFSCEFKDGKANGLAQFVSENENLVAQGYINNGEVIGKWFFYNSSGKLHKRSIYRAGKSLPVEMTVFDNMDRPMYHYVCKDDNFLELKKTFIY